MNYYEHETRVKIIENILNRSKDWKWFINYTEENFNPDFTIDSFQDAISAFKEIHEVFEFLCRIREITDENFDISKDWLNDLDQLALFFLGKVDLNSLQLVFDLSKVHLLLIFTGKIYSQTTNEKYYFYAEIFKLRNLCSLIDLSLFIDEEKRVHELLDIIEIDVSQERKIFEDNINNVFYPPNHDFVEKHKNQFLSPDAFSFVLEKDENISVWEEQELLNMLKMSYRNETLTPLFSNGTSHTPEYERWTLPILEHMADYFNADSANFIIESVKFALHKIVPSENTINAHFELLQNLSVTLNEDTLSSISCSSLEFIISFFNNEKCLKLIGREDRIKFDKVLNHIKELKGYHVLFEIKERKALQNQKINDELNAIIQSRLNDIGTISNHRELTAFIGDKKIYRAINNDSLKQLSNKFDELIPISDLVFTPSVFLEYFLFLMRIKNNKEIDSFAVGTEIIRIRKLWKQEYYKKCRNAMTVIKSGPFVVPKGIEDIYVYSILVKPISFAANSLKLTDNDILDCMIQVADNPLLLLASRIIIAEDFPQKPFIKIDGKHPIDEFYLNEIEKQIQSNGYKLRNSFKPIEFASSIYDRIKDELRMKVTFPKNIQPLYDAVILQNPEYDFIDFTEKVTLAHLTQLFPILENQIRNFGELFGIVPICENEDLYHRLKEPDGILKTVISRIYEMENSLTHVADLFFIHFCMYGENGLNIRNDCIHGNGYFTNEQISFAFRITLICLYMVGNRYMTITENLVKNPGKYLSKNASKKRKRTFWHKLTDTIFGVIKKRKI